MSTKRTNGPVRQEEDAKRGKTEIEIQLYDLPTEILHNILIKVVAMEVQSMKLAKRVWEEKADLVISRLETVCSHWSNVLTTDFFRMELHRALDRTAEGEIALEIVRRYPIDRVALAVSVLGRHVYVLRKDVHLGFVLDVVDQFNFAISKTIIRLTEINPKLMVSHTPANSIFVVSQDVRGNSVVRLRMVSTNSCEATVWIQCDPEPISYISISPCGALSMITQDSRGGSALKNYDHNGGFLYSLLFRRTAISRVESAVKTSNGNFVITAINSNGKTFLGEVDEYGTQLRVFPFELKTGSLVFSAAGVKRFIVYSGWDSDLTMVDTDLNRTEYGAVQFTGFLRPDIATVHSTGVINQFCCVVQRYGRAANLTLFTFRLREF